MTPLDKAGTSKTPEPSFNHLIVHFKPKSEAEDEKEPTIPKVDGAIQKSRPLYSEKDYSEETIE